MKQLFLWILFLSTILLNGQNNISYGELSKNLLQNIIDGKPYDKEVNILSKSTLDELVTELKTDKQKIAFWVNIYNAFIQISLTENPKLYDDRGVYFKTDRVKIAGQVLSFDDIEHGIIRKSRWKLSLGYLSKPFRAKWETKLRVKNIDWRIHFALNCGAKSCPPVAVYTSWFRGDFGGKCGAIKILKAYKITPEKPKKLDFKSYDWTLLLGNYRTIPK